MNGVTKINIDEKEPRQHPQFAAHCAKASAAMMFLAYLGLNYLVVSGSPHQYISAVLCCAFAFGFWWLVRQEDRT